MDAFIQQIADSLSKTFGDPRVVVLLIAFIPIVEARLAIPMGITSGLSVGESFGFAFLGSALAAPILLIVLIPIINALSRTKLFSKIGKFLYEKFEKKSKSVSDEQVNNAVKPSMRERLIGGKPTKKEWKKLGGTALFVAVPLPLTGVWTGSAVASIMKLPYFKGLAAVVFGNLVASGIITLLCFFLQEYINTITLVIAIIAIAVILFLIVKLILFKPKTATANSDAVSDDSTPEQSESEINDQIDDTNSQSELQANIDETKDFPNNTVTKPFGEHIEHKEKE